MPTTIDSLEIELSSSAQGASQGVENLIGSLKRLKRSSNKLNQLSTAISTLKGSMVGFPDGRRLNSAADGLERIGSLKFSGTLPKTIDGISKISTLDIPDDTGDKMKKLREDLQPLTTVELKGLSGAMGHLEKFDKTVEKLSDDNIDKFAQKTAKLTENMRELAEVSRPIAEAFKGINLARNNTDRVVKAVHGNTLGLLVKTLALLKTAGNTIRDATEQAVDWDSISARFDRAFGRYAESEYRYVRQLERTMGVNAQGFMQYESTYASMLQGLGVEFENSTRMARGYTEMAYDIWAAYNDRANAESFAEVSRSISSAIAGQTRSLKQLGITINDSQMQLVAYENGITTSISNMNEAQKSELRYLTILKSLTEQGIIGTYVNELDTAEGLLRTTKQQLNSLTQEFGSLFLPILAKTLPYVQAFVSLLREAVQRIAGFFGIKIQDVDWSNYNKGAGGFADNLEDARNSAKKIKDYTMGFDELNVINPNSGSAGGLMAGGLGLDLNSVWDESILKRAQEQVDKIKQSLKDLTPLLFAVAGGIGAIVAYKTFPTFWEAAAKGLLAFNLEAFTTYAAVGLIGAGLGLMVYGIYEVVTGSEEMLKACTFIAGGLALVGAGISLLTGGWLPLLVAGVIGAGVLIYGYIKDTGSDMKRSIQVWLGDRLLNVQEFLNEIISAVNWAVTKINEIFGTQLNTLDPFTFADRYIARLPAGNGITTRATGGYVPTGQMFIARERGAELVGNIGNRTAVANNDQIVEAVSSGVYQAVMSAIANRNGSDEQNINVYLDGRQITASVENIKKSWRIYYGYASL